MYLVTCSFRQTLYYIKGGHHYINISNDDALPVGVQEVVAFRVSTEDFGDSPLHLREAGEDVLCKCREKSKLSYARLCPFLSCYHNNKHNTWTIDINWVT